MMIQQQIWWLLDGGRLLSFLWDGNLSRATAILNCGGVANTQNETWLVVQCNLDLPDSFRCSGEKFRSQERLEQNYKKNPQDLLKFCWCFLRVSCCRSFIIGYRGLFVLPLSLQEILKELSHPDCLPLGASYMNSIFIYICAFFGDQIRVSDYHWWLQLGQSQAFDFCICIYNYLRICTNLSMYLHMLFIYF